MSPPRVSRGTPSLNTDEKESEEEEGDDMNSNVSVWPPDPRPPDDRVHPHSLPSEAATNEPVDPISRPETSSAEPNATRRQSVVPAWWRQDCCSVPNRSRILSVEQDFPLDFLQDPWRGIKDIPQICTARVRKR